MEEMPAVYWDLTKNVFVQLASRISVWFTSGDTV
ncbi:hypothetical protein J2782_002917 [Brucella pseudogrignonensis]|uniref:Uncharacterized protein n=1 Tax=Brucella pseudogrignonensis TaxID=419475 RepID=A0ABU1MBN3_9HYPH|nr:hypothetical protein [Brucella pseudogrignonensis]